MNKKVLTIITVFVIVLCLMLLFITRFYTSNLFPQDGYFVTGNTIEKNLMSNYTRKSSKQVELVKMSSEDTMYSNLGRVYVGNDDHKTEVNTKYPIYTNNGLAIVNTNARNKLINSRFEQFDTYENFTLTDAKIYNYSEFEQSDYEEYYFLLLENGVYVNAQKMTFVLTNIKKIIPINSIINFQEDAIRYYYYDKSGKLIFNQINGISLSDSVLIGEKELSYEQLLIRLGLLNEKEEDDDDEYFVEEEPYIIENSGYDGSTVHIPKEYKYVKPKVSSDNFEVNVYSGSSNLMISDPAGVIAGAVNFQFYIGEKLYSRKAFVSSGKIQVLGLIPNTDFHIVGSYRYYDENGKKIEATFFEQDVHTGDYKSLNAIELAFDNGPIYSNKIELNRLRIISSLDNEALKGLNKANITINGNSYSISSDLIQQMIQGKEVTYSSPTSLKSDQVQNYEITLLDGFGNSLNISNYKGSTRTSKEIPSSSFKVIKSDVSYSQFEISLKNKDHVSINNYRYILFKNDNTIVAEEELNPSLSSQVFTNSKLDPNSIYNVRILGDYDTLDGNGTIRDAVLGENKFTTMPLSSLGYLRVNTLASNLTDHSASIEFSLDTQSVSSVLLQLLSSFSIEVKNELGNIVFSQVFQNEKLSEFVSGQKEIFDIDGLDSVSSYDIIFSSTVTQGTVSESINVISSLKNFKTLKKDAYVVIQNQFVNHNMIDFDVKVVDEDLAIESDSVLLEIRDSMSKLIAMESLKVNGDFVQLSYTKLEENADYTFKYYAEEYNVGYNNSTFDNDHVLRVDTINTQDGISGTIELQEMLRQVTGDNLFNINDYDRLRKEGNTGYKKYDLNNNAVMFGAKNGYVNFSYYLPEIYGKKIMVRFSAKYDSNTPFTTNVYLSKSFNDTRSFEITGLSQSEYKDYEFTFDSNSNYVGFIIAAPASRNERTDVWFKDIEIISVTDQTLPVSVSYHPSGYRFTNTIMHSGREYFTSYDENNSYLLGNPNEGHARITDISTNKSYDFDYTGDSQEFVAPKNGNYRVELWGAAGGRDLSDNVLSTRRGGYGAYTAGDIYLNAGTKFYVYVGGKGADGVKGKISPGGWNGGGYGDWDHTDDETYGGGGGATDIRITGGEWNNEESLKSRIMVAAGGGGSAYGSDGGDAGALSSFVAYSSAVATQTSGYAFGYGQDGIMKRKNYPIGGAGGGYYGGFATDNGNYYNPGSGGSSYISGYAGCVAYDKKNSLPSSTYSGEYKELDEYLASFKIDLLDRKSEIATEDYYVRIYLDGKEISGSPFRYDLVDHKAIGEIQQYSLRKNKKYTISLEVKIRNRFYEIDSIIINTNKEIRSIRNIDELFGLHPNGKYVVVNDLDISSVNRSITNFYGDLDFQGHTLTMNWNGRNYLFQYTRGGSIVKNVVINLSIDNPTGKSWTSPFVLYHYGTLDNIQLNVVQCAETAANYASGLLAYANYGVIKNFVIHNMVEVHARARFGLVTYSNQGLIKDGYVYGEDIYAYHAAQSNISKDVGAIAAESTTNSRIQRVFSLIGVKRDSIVSTEQAAGNLVGYANVGKMENCFSVEDDDLSTNLSTQDPNFGRRNSMSAINVYYFSKKTYVSTISSKLSFLALYDSSFLNNLLNKEKRYKVDSFVSLGFYPQLVMNDCMPNLDWIPLPSISDEDLIDITSVEEESNDGDSAIIRLHLNNPAAEKITSIGIQDIQAVEVLSQEDDHGKSVVRAKMSNPLAYRSKYYLRKIVSKSASGVSYDTLFGEKERPLDITMYYAISSMTDWKRMNQYPSENYILIKDMDFSGISENDIYISKPFNGVFNGNGHKLKNITINTKGGVFERFNNNGVMKNVFIENYDKSSGTTSYGGFVYQTFNTVLFDNVHMTDVKVRASGFIGSLIGYGRGSMIINCSVTNFKSYQPTEASDIRIGGLIGYLDGNGYISNSYAQDVDIEILDSISTYGVGGIVGQMSSGSITNVYATGSIKSNSIYTGGIVGYASAIISNCWTDVNIYSELDYVGGIIGKRDHDNLSSTLVFGPTYSIYSSQYTNINRTSGNPLLVPQKNFYWDNQPFFGFVGNDSSHEKSLTDEQIKNVETYYDLLDFENNFSYEGIENGILPKLRDTSGNLLPNQKDHKIEKQKFNVRGTIEVSQRVEDGDVHFILENPDNYEITSVIFDYLKVETSNLQITNTGQGYTIVSASRVKPLRYYDVYTLTGVTYKPSRNAVPVTVPKYIKIDLQFFKNISSYTDWRSISTTTTENYRLTADIDFTGITNINSNVSIGRLEGQGDGHTIRNITVNNISASYSLIRKITTSLKNVTFDHITLNTKDTGSIGSYCNIIRLNFADVDNVQFNNVTIHAPIVNNYVAPIGINRAQSLRNISISGNNITGKSYVGGLIGSSQAYDAFNVTADHITVYGSGDCVGGVVGLRDYSGSTRWFNFTATNMNVTGKTNTGGVFGYGGANYTSIKDSTITGLSGGTRLGGIAANNRDRYAYYYNAENITIIAENVTEVGGLFGRAYDVSYAYIKNSTITNNGTENVYTGGFMGYKSGYTDSYIGVIDTKVTSQGIGGTGGLFGYSGGAGVGQYSYTNNVEINGVNNVGGAIGYGRTSRQYYTTLNVKINASGTNVGGVYGYMYDVDLTDSNYSNVAHEIILENSEITGADYVSLFAGHVPGALANSLFYNIYLVGNVKATGAGARYGIVVPIDSSSSLTISDNLPRFYVYNNNKLNNNLITSIDFLEDTRNHVTMVTSDNLKTQTYYTGHGITTSYFIFTDYDGNNLITGGYYPFVKTVQNQTPIKVPTSDTSFDLRMSGASASAGGPHEIPKLKAYSSGIQTVNLEFETDDFHTKMEVFDGEKSVFDDYVSQRTYTFMYDYLKPIHVLLSDGLNRREYTFEPEELRSVATTFKSSYAYLYDEELKGNIKSTNAHFIHLYDKYALTDNQDIYNLETGKYDSKDNSITLALAPKVQSLFHFKVGTSTIDTFGLYSIIHKVEGDVFYDGQLFYKNGVIEIVDANLDNVKTTAIVDSSGNRRYVSILGNDGVLYHLKDELRVPSNFTNAGIRYMSHNINNDANMVVIVYETGRVVIFDYRTGTVKIAEKAVEKVSIFDYVKSNIQSKESVVKDNTLYSYSDSLELIKLLEDKPISDDGKGNYVSGDSTTDKKSEKYQLKSNYSTYYNAVKNSYDVLDVSDIVLGDETDVITENDKIYSSNDLVSFYMRDSIMDSSTNNIDIIVLLEIVLLSVIITLGLWFKNARDLQKKES